MATSEVTTRRRVAVLDGAGRHELALAPHVTLADAVRSLGIELEEGRRLLVGPGGTEVRPIAEPRISPTVPCSPSST